MPSILPSLPRINIGSIHVDVVTKDQVLRLLEEKIETQEGGYLVTPNVDHVVQAQTHELLKKSYAEASLSVADGMPILWASRILGQPLPEKISGSDLIMPTLELANKKNWRVYFLGGSQKSSDLATEKLNERFPALKIVGRSTTPIDLNDHEGNKKIISEIKKLNVDLLIVCLGCPKQEVWMNLYQNDFAPAFAMGLGASLDFIAGVAKRSPKIISNIGLEWAFRLMKEPRRLWRRYLLRDPKFLAIFINSYFRRMSGRSA